MSVSSLVQLASGSNEPGDGGGRSKISGLVRQCNFRWWPRRSALQVGDSQNHAPVICIGYSKLPLQLSTRRFLQFARASSVPAGRKSRGIGRGVRGFKLVMVSAVSASSWRFRGRGARARTSEGPAVIQVERHESGAVGEWFERPWGEQRAKGTEVSINLR